MKRIYACYVPLICLCLVDFCERKFPEEFEKMELLLLTEPFMLSFSVYIDTIFTTTQVYLGQGIVLKRLLVPPLNLIIYGITT